MTDKEFQKYVAKQFNARLEELGISRYKFITENGLFKSINTISRVFRGTNGSNMSTVNNIADLLGLEIIIRKKQNNEGKD